MANSVLRPLLRPLVRPAVRGVFEVGGVSLAAKIAAFGARLIWWYEAASSDTLGQTSAGVSAVASGDPIGYIADKSPTGLNLTQATGAKRIKLGTDSGGRPVFHFDGTKTISLDSASINLSAHTKITVFFAGYVDATDAVIKVPFYFNPTGNGFAALANGTGLTLRYQNAANHEDLIQSAASTTPTIFELQYVPSATRQLEVVQGIANGKEWAQTKGTATDPSTPGTFPTGILRFGDWGAANFSWEGGISAMLAVTGDVTDAERDLIRRYLAGVSGAEYPLPWAALPFSHANNYRTMKSSLGFAAYAYSTLYYDTSATSVDVTYICDALISGGYTSLGIYVDGAYYTQVTPSGAGTFTATVSLPEGYKRVGILNSAATGNSAGVYPTQSRVTNVEFNNSAQAYDFPTTGRILIYGDSVATGGHASPLVENAWPLKIRAQTGEDVCVYAESGRSFKTDYDHASYGDAFRDTFVKTVEGYAPATLWMAMGVNDYNQAAWTAAAFGTAYAATLDALHTALPSLQIYAQSPLNPAYGAVANAQGDTLQDYCDAIQTACTGRAWATYVDGSTIITDPGTELTDGVHPDNAGNATYAAFVISELGL